MRNNTLINFIVIAFAISFLSIQVLAIDTPPSAINENFKRNIASHNYVLQKLDDVEKFTLVDNLRHIKSLFDEQEAEGFFSYQQLSRYAINNKSKGTSAGVYVFRFENESEALIWFTIVKSSHESHRLMVFGKPKKMMALAGQEVILIEGYHMSNYVALNFLIEQLDGVQMVLGVRR